MMSFFKQLSRAQWLIGLSLTLLLLLWLIILVQSWGQYRGYHEQSKNLVPRIARLEGLVASEAALKEANQQIAGEIATKVYPVATDPASTGTAMQQQIRGVFAKAGLTVSGSQILPPRIDQLFTRIQLEVAASGSMEALELALLELAELQPIVMIDSINVQPARARRGDASQSVTVRLRLTSLRMLP